MERLKALIVMAGLALPFSTWYGFYQPVTVFDLGYFATPLWAFSALGLALAALTVVYPRDRVVGAFATYAALSVLWSPIYTLSIATWVVIGAIFYVSVPAAGGLVRPALVALALMQTILLVAQAVYGRYLPIGQWDVNIIPYPHGTFGNSRYLAVLLAVAAPIAPPVVAVFLFVGAILTKSLGAVVAIALALAVRIGYDRYGRALVTLPIAAVGIGSVLMLRGWSPDGIAVRTHVWLIYFADWTATWAGLIFGKGLGAFYTNAGAFQQTILLRDRDALFWHAHNEPFQLGYELGLAGLAFLAVFCWQRRAMLRDPAVVALAVMCLTIAPFHIPTVAVIALAVLGSTSCPSISWSRLWSRWSFSSPLAGFINRKAAVGGAR